MVMIGGNVYIIIISWAYAAYSFLSFLRSFLGFVVYYLGPAFFFLFLSFLSAYLLVNSLSVWCF